MMNAKSLVLLGAGVVGLAAGSGAYANDVVSLPSVRVSYADLNLSNDAGVTRLYARLKSAAKQVCELTAMPTQAESGCMTRALNQAVASVGNERLAELHGHVRQTAAGA